MLIHLGVVKLKLKLGAKFGFLCTIFMMIMYKFFLGATHKWQSTLVEQLTWQSGAKFGDIMTFLLPNPKVASNLGKGGVHAQLPAPGWQGGQIPRSREEGEGSAHTEDEKMM